MMDTEADRAAQTGVTAPLLAMLVRSAAVLVVLAAPMVPSPAPVAENAPVGWKQSWAERYPGCVPAVLWPAGEQPVAVVTRTPDGRVERVALADERRPVRPVPSRATTVGVCR